MVPDPPDQQPDPDKTVIHGAGDTRAVPTGDAWVGREVAGYEIKSILGRGGMGIVYRAWDPALERTLALKSIRSEVLDKDGRARFLTEARACSRLNHPNIVTVYAAGEADDTPYLAMEFVEGRTLGEVLEERTPDWEEAVQWTAALLGALECLHSEGIIHRDLKPHNVMLTKDGVVKLMDFGLAKMDTNVTMTVAGMAMGTAAYMSPEQAGGQRVDARSDIFSAGTMLYQLLAGRLPFTGDQPLSVMYAIQNNDAPPLARDGAKLPAELRTVVRRAMARDPEKRYASAAEFRDQLNSLISAEASVTPSSAWRKPLWAGLVALIAVASFLLIQLGSGPDSAAVREVAMQHNELGQSYQAQGKLVEAASEYQAAIDADDSYSVPFNNLAALAMQGARWSRADSLLQRAQQLDPSYAPAYFNRGGVLWQLEDLSGAEREYRLAIKADPDGVLSYSNLGVLYLENDRLGEARTVLEEGLARDDDNIRVQYNMARLEVAEGDTTRALERLRRVLQRAPEDRSSRALFQEIGGESTSPE